MPPSGELLSALARLTGGEKLGEGDPLVTDVTHDSRQAGPGCLFVAIPGFTADGHDFAAAAVAGGSAALMVERALDLEIPQLVVASSRRAIAPVAAAVHGNPSQQLSVVGITGTNGKTSVTYLIEAIAQAAGIVAGVIGTVQTRVGGEPIPTLRTTPEASDFQRLLRLMSDRGAGIVAAEVSSHALELGRVDATRFAVAAFTNLSQDHLDFHPDMEAYFAAKAALFAPGRAERAVVWIDDPWGARLAGGLQIPITTVAVEADADLVGRVEGADLAGTDLAVRFPTGEWRAVRIPIPGGFHVANAMVATGCGLALGLGPDVVLRGLARAQAIPGRFEVVSPAGSPVVIVDYAHTPAGIDGAIAAARRLTTGRIVALVGAGGDRDRAKRPMMGAAASAADLVVITSDNPRSEDPDAIIRAVAAGVPPSMETMCEPDRRRAIRLALEWAGEGDTVLILGRGHERGQEISGRMLPFDDREVARSELARLREVEG